MGVWPGLAFTDCWTCCLWYLTSLIFQRMSLQVMWTSKTINDIRDKQPIVAIANRARRSPGVSGEIDSNGPGLSVLPAILPGPFSKLLQVEKVVRTASRRRWHRGRSNRTGNLINVR